MDDLGPTDKVTSGKPMHNSKPDARGGGFFISFCTIAGTIIGGLLGQPSVGLLSGIALGVVIALLLLLDDRNRRRK